MAGLIKTFEYGITPNSYDALKILALVTMVIDHVGSYLLPDWSWMRVIGRFAFPIFAFLVGYSTNYKHNNYLLIGAIIISVLEYMLHQPLFSLNILWSLYLTRLAMRYLIKSKVVENELAILSCILGLFYVPTAIIWEYGTLTILIALMGWLVRSGRQDKVSKQAAIVTALLWIGMQSISFEFDIFQIAAIVIETILLSAIFLHFRVREVKMPLPKLSLLLARNTLIIYVLHLAILLYAEYTWFPERLPPHPYFIKIDN